ncbi:c-type cytochrome [Roseibium algae]|uniref:Cytochrome c n=1 Tax=Roseibium algae TaxID=3123038 RepID=A0ABU8TMV7_9HYPH
MATMKRDFWALVTGGSAVLIFSATAGMATETYPDDPASIASGLELAEIHCAVCHAVGRSDKSAQSGAPAFRDLSKRYPLSSLEESLAEGIVTAHDGMPEFAFESEDINAFLGYLTSIQVP